MARPGMRRRGVYPKRSGRQTGEIGTDLTLFRLPARRKKGVVTSCSARQFILAVQRPLPAVGNTDMFTISRDGALIAGLYWCNVLVYDVHGGQLVTELAIFGQPVIALVVVGPDVASGFDVTPDEALQRGSSIVRNDLQPNTTGLVVADQLDGADDGDLANGAATLTAADRLVLSAIRYRGLVDLNISIEREARGIDHGTAQLVEQQPGGLV
jgi:hypothetical protein